MKPAQSIPVHSVETLQRELLQTRKELDALKEEYRDFAYIVSHDLSAPLRQAEGFARIISTKYTGTFDEKSTRHMEMIMSSAQKGQSLLEGLLYFSRLNTRSGVFVPVSLERAFEQAKKQLARIIRETNATITADTLPDIVGDVDQLQLLCFHLLDNGLKFQPKDAKPHITIRCSQQDKMVHITFTDNGIGLNKDYYEQACKIFQRCVPKDSHYKGAGMGLALVRKIVKLHSGTMSIAAATEGCGTSVTVSFPALSRKE